MSQAWILLVIAGALEVVWAVGLKSTNGFTRILPSLWVGGAIVGSLYLLALAQRTLPIAVAYAVWMGIGTLGTALVSAFWLRNPLSTAEWFFLVLLLVSVIGLKVSASA
jgi:quaternary ammonium compound-resistance protein SugE